MKNIKRKNFIRRLFNLSGIEYDIFSTGFKKFKSINKYCNGRTYGSIFESEKKKKLYKKTF